MKLIVNQGMSEYNGDGEDAADSNPKYVLV